MLHINKNQEVIAWVTKKAEAELQEGDTIITTRKKAEEANLADAWDSAKPKKEKAVRDPNAPRATPVKTPTEGKYTVLKSDSTKAEKNEARAAVFNALFSGNDVAEFLANAKPYLHSDGATEITPNAVLAYSLKRKFVEMVA